MKPWIGLSLTALSATTLSGCSFLNAPETPLECADRWERQLDEGFAHIGDKFDAIIYPTYGYDVSGLDEDARAQWIGLTRPIDTPHPRMAMALGGNAATLKDWLSRDVGPDGAYFASGDTQIIRERGKPVSFSEMIAQGCAKSEPGISLIHIHFAFNAFGGGDDAAPDTGLNTLTFPDKD